jgi:hypothetical protein
MANAARDAAAGRVVKPVLTFERQLRWGRGPER